MKFPMMLGRVGFERVFRVPKTLGVSVFVVISVRETTRVNHSSTPAVLSRWEQRSEHTEFPMLLTDGDRHFASAGLEQGQQSRVLRLPSVLQRVPVGAGK